MSLRDTLTPADWALVEGCAEPDLPSGMPPLAALLQSTSLQLQPGNEGYVPGAVMGDFVVPRDGGLVLVKGATGITFVPVGFETTWPQFRPFRQGWAGVTHAEKPANALWLKPEKTVDYAGRERPASPDGKEGHYLIDVDGKPGDKIEETLYLHMLVLPGDGHPPHGVSFAFHSTSLSIGNDFEKRAERLQVEIDGKPLKGYVVGKWKLSSEYKENDTGFGWHKPVLSLIGKLGEAHGPSITEMRQAARLRASFKQGSAWVASGPAMVANDHQTLDGALDGPPKPPPPSFIDGALDGPPEPPPYERNPEDEDGVEF